MARKKKKTTIEDYLGGLFDDFLLGREEGIPIGIQNDLGLIIDEKMEQIKEQVIDLSTDLPDDELNETQEQVVDIRKYHNTFTDFKLDEPITLEGEKDRFRKNIEAIKLINEIYPKIRPAKCGEIELQITSEQQRIIASFSGWGGINGLFDPKNEKWKNERTELLEIFARQELLENGNYSQKEIENIIANFKKQAQNGEIDRKGLFGGWGEYDFDMAKESNLTAYYTPKNIVEAIYKGLDRLGINTDRPELKKEILEPSAGNGSFLAFNKNPNLNFTTIEKETFTAKMNAILYPNQKNYNAGYEIFNRDSQYDAVVGNPPFLDIKIADKIHGDLYNSAHNFFTQKATQYSLKKDGITAFVVSRHFLDAKYNYARDEIAQNHTFLGAVRLPNNVFKHTDAETDIIFMQKGKHEYGYDISQISNTQTINGEEVSQNINQYFIDNPQNILAEPTYRIGQFGKAIFFEPKENFNLDNALNDFIQTLPTNVYKWHEPAEIKDYGIENYKDNYDYAKSLSVGSIFIDEEQIVKRVESIAVDDIRVAKLDLPNKSIEKALKKYIPIRDKLLELVKLEQTKLADDDPKLAQTRRELNILLDNFHQTEGFLHNQKFKCFSTYDNQYSKVLALEVNYKKSIRAKNGRAEQIESCEKANILSRRTINFTPEISFESVKDGVFASVYTYGKIDLEFISKKLKKDIKEIEKEIIKERIAFYDPKKLAQGEKELIFAPIYLSGNVKEKLQNVKDLKEIYSQELQTNYEELYKVIPKDISFTDIEIKLGSSWIPTKYYDDFLKKELDSNNVNYFNWKLQNLGDMGWRINGVDTFSYKTILKYGVSVKNKTFERKIGDKTITHIAVGGDKSIYDIIESAFNNTPIKIMEKTDEPLKDQNGNTIYDKNGNIKYKQVVCPELTAEAKAKVDLIKRNFGDWVINNRIVAKELKKIYNNKYNCYVGAKFDGDGLTFNGLDSNIKLRKHQKDAVFRSMINKNILLDHEVGAGKTYAAIASVMKQKELGLVKKPLIIVPNNLVTQWESEFMQAYPNAKILVAGEHSLNPQQRDDFLSQVQNNDWDAVVIKYTQIDRLPVPYDTKQKILKKELNELESALEYYEERDEMTNKKSARRVLKTILKTKEKLKNLTDDREKSKIMDFSMLGVDSIVVDEAHNFKNLAIISPMKAKGLGATQSSQRAFNMLALTTYINDRDDGKVMFLTGTPVSNSLSEIYNMQRFLQPKELEKQEIDSFSKWASIFAGIDVAPVRDASGRIKMEARFSSLTNLPELSNMLTQVTDTITNDDIRAFNEDFIPNKETIYRKSKKSDLIAEYIGVPDEYGRYSENSITGRLLFLESGASYDPSIDNHLKVTSDAKKASIDFRLIEPNAPDYPNSKINCAVEDIVREYKENDYRKGTQLVFLDVGTPKSNSEKSFNIKFDDDFSRDEVKIEYADDNSDNLAQALDKAEQTGKVLNADIDENGAVQESEEFDDSRFFLYGDIYKKLVQKGIPREQIAFIHDTQTNEEKKELFRKVNDGEIRVLLGSRPKMGTGVNVQKRIVAMHHLDCPWKPGEITQSNGRGIRQGNIFFEKDPQNFAVKEYRHVTPGTFDERNWELQSKKNEAILNFRKGTCEERSLKGFEEDLISSNEARAVASDNPLIYTEFELNDAIKTEQTEIKHYKEQVFSSEEEIEKNKIRIERLKKTIDKTDDLKLVVVENSTHNLNIKMNSFIGSDNGIEMVQNDFFIPKYDKGDFEKMRQELIKNIQFYSWNDFNKAYNELQGFDAVKERLKHDSNDTSSKEYAMFDELRSAVLKDRFSGVAQDIKRERNEPLSFVEKIIKPELEKSKEKQMQMAQIFNASVNLLYAKKGSEVEIMEYRGFKLVGVAEDTKDGTEVWFSLKNESKNIELQPKTLDYSDNIDQGLFAREQIKFVGVMSKINNVLSEKGITARLEENKFELENLKEKNTSLENWLQENKSYPKQELLDNLLKDYEICKVENEKIIANRHYKSTWQSEALSEYKNYDKKQKEIRRDKIIAEEKGMSLEEYLVTKEQLKEPKTMNLEKTKPIQNEANSVKNISQQEKQKTQESEKSKQNTSNGIEEIDPF